MNTEKGNTMRTMTLVVVLIGLLLATLEARSGDGDMRGMLEQSRQLARERAKAAVLIDLDAMPLPERNYVSNSSEEGP